MVYYYTYKITCLKGSLKGCYYFGKHRTSNLNDNYRGSGTIIKDYFKKYGVVEGETFIKEILAFYNDQKELDTAEYNLITEVLGKDKKCLNITHGGAGGFCNMNEEIASKISDNMKQKSTDFYKERNSWKIGKKDSDKTKAKKSESMKGNKNSLGNTAWNKGISITEDRRRKIIKNAETNPNYGMKNKKMSSDAKDKMRKAKLGKHWRINIETNKREWY